MTQKIMLKHEFVEYIPNDLKDGTVYVSVAFAIAAHKCCCGCGNEVVTPLSPTGWRLTFDGESISLDPSIGNWSFRCKSHYWIERNKVRWAPRWSEKKIQAGRAQDRLMKESYFNSAKAPTGDETKAGEGGSQEERSGERLAKVEELVDLSRGAREQVSKTCLLQSEVSYTMMTSISRSRVFAALLSVAMIGIASIGGMAEAERAIPDDNLAYPVLITLKNGNTGSGFYLNTGKAVYLVTAKHVLFDPKNQKLLDPALELLSYSKDPSDSSRNLITVDLSAVEMSGNIKSHPSEDVVVVKLSTVLPGGSASSFLGSMVHGATLREMASGGLLTVNVDNVKSFDQVLTGNEVMLFGYPTSLGLQQLPQIDIQRPLLRKGIVAGTNPRTRSIILDCPAYFGNSGGPVLELDKEAFTTTFKIIGVMREYVPFVDRGRSFQMVSNSGYSIATPMDYVLDLIQ